MLSLETGRSAENARACHGQDAIREQHGSKGFGRTKAGPLLIAERLHGIEAGGAGGRVKTRNERDQHGKDDSAQD